MHTPCFHLLVSFIEHCSQEHIVMCSKHLFRKMGYEVDMDEVVNYGYKMSILEEDVSCFKVIRSRNHTVGLPLLRNFVGELAGMKVRKGIVITPYMYSRQAIRYAEILDDSMELIDGEEFAELCIKYDIFTE